MAVSSPSTPIKFLSCRDSNISTSTNRLKFVNALDTAYEPVWVRNSKASENQEGLTLGLIDSPCCAFSF